ncbi:MAG: PASTA domain-containing protein [Endomicrobium sp.]|uniref:PASTA domain-containing protein n=1 Tax=Candidatus Endomicrobiellum pyrsonymphae TaxID=1408203 RepID=UPI00358493C1|nr:PASTA domain-containing protein [Endomicrobium sp.]
MATIIIHRQILSATSFSERRIKNRLEARIEEKLQQIIIEGKILSHKLSKVFIALAIIGTAIYFAFNMIMSSLVHSNKEIVTPNVVGKSLYNALEELSKEGFGIKKDGEEPNQNVPTGTILRQNPLAGMTVRGGKIIRVTLSQGGEIIYVPDLIGQTIRSADIALRYATLVMGEVSRKFSIFAEKGIVISQDTVAGSKVDKDSVVNIVVSDGMPPEGIILMPNFINKNIERAKTWAEEHGINVNVKSEESSNIETNTITEQYPAADTDVTDEKNITVTVAVNLE